MSDEQVEYTFEIEPFKTEQEAVDFAKIYLFNTLRFIIKKTIEQGTEINVVTREINWVKEYVVEIEPLPFESKSNAIRLWSAIEIEIRDVLKSQGKTLKVVSSDVQALPLVED